MNVLDFNTMAGWPGSTETWKFLQDMILQLQQASLLGGNSFIISGCNSVAGNVTNGWVVINGEVCPFEGGPVQPNVVVVDEVENRDYFGGASNPYYHRKKATFGSGTGAVAWEDFKRNDPANGVLSRLDRVEKMLKPLIGYDDPANPGTTIYGSWMFWGRPASEIPVGWEAVPDEEWKGRVPVVADDTDVDFEMLSTGGKTGGEKEHTLTINEMPAHGHPINGSDRTDFGGGGKVAAVGARNSEGAGNTESVGGGQAHNNLQPYKVVLFIRFTG